MKVSFKRLSGSGDYFATVEINKKINITPHKLTLESNKISKLLNIESKEVKKEIINFQNSLEDWEIKKSVSLSEKWDELRNKLIDLNIIWQKSRQSQSTYIFCKKEDCECKLKISDHDKSDYGDSLKASDFQTSYEIKKYDNFSKYGTENLLLLKNGFSITKAINSIKLFLENH